MAGRRTTAKRKEVEEQGNLPAVTFLNENIPIAKIIEYRNKKLSYDEIAKLLGCTAANICTRLKPFRPSLENIESIKHNRADTLAVVSDTILNSLSHEDIQKSSAYQRVGMYGVLYDKERLERGQSSSNIAYMDMSRDQRDLDREIQALEAEIGTNDVHDAEQGD